MEKPLYENANIKENVKWVKDNIMKNTKRTVNGITFELYGKGNKNRNITIYKNEAFK